MTARITIGQERESHLRELYRFDEPGPELFHEIDALRGVLEDRQREVVWWQAEYNKQAEDCYADLERVTKERDGFKERHLALLNMKIGRAHV